MTQSKQKGKAFSFLTKENAFPLKSWLYITQDGFPSCLILQPIHWWNRRLYRATRL